MFTATVDAREVDLVNKVASMIDPLAFDRSSIHGSDAERREYERIQDNNRQRAREIAVEIIAAVRDFQ